MLFGAAALAANSAHRTGAGLVEVLTPAPVAPVVDALSGRPANLRRQPPRGDAVVVSAAVPIRSDAGIRGAVLVEQTTNAILSIQNLALQRLFGVTLVLFAVTSLGLLVFASLLASRITRLRDRVEAAVDLGAYLVRRWNGCVPEAVEVAVGGGRCRGRGPGLPG